MMGLLIWRIPPILFSLPIETPLLSLHVSANTEMGEIFGTVLPTRFSDFWVWEVPAPFAVRLPCGFNFRALFSLSGPDRQRYLNAF